MSTLKSAVVATTRRRTLKKKALFFARDDFFLCISSCFFSSVLLSAILWTGEVWEFLSFTERFPGVIYNILLFGVTSALGQVGGGTKERRTEPC